MHLHSFTVHILLATYPIMLTAGRDIRPQAKYLPGCVGLALALAVPVYCINLALGTNFMFLMRADAGNPLRLFEQAFGNHLLGYPVLAGAIFAVMYGLPCCQKRLRARLARRIRYKTAAPASQGRGGCCAVRLCGRGQGAGRFADIGVHIALHYMEGRGAAF